jgi:hypothetical protein
MHTHTRIRLYTKIAKRAEIAQPDANGTAAPQPTVTTLKMEGETKRICSNLYCIKVKICSMNKLS